VVKVNDVLRAMAMRCEQTYGAIGFETSDGRVEYRRIVLIPILSGLVRSNTRSKK